MKSNQVPEIRFPEFTGDWKQRKLGDILQEFSVKSKIENEYKVLSSTNSGMEIRKGRVSGTSNQGYKIIEDGCLVLSPQNLWLGNININNIGVGLVSPSYKTFKFTKANSKFIGPQLRTQRMLEAYKNASSQGASLVRRNLELDSFYQIAIHLPNDNEQDKIANFFNNMDSTIVLYKGKLDLLKELKKGFLQKMFPKEGEKVPEVRFPGFNDAWEQRKFSDEIKLIGGATPFKGNETYWNGDIIWLSSQEIKAKYVNKGTFKITEKAVSDNTTKMVSAGTPLIVSRSGILAKRFPISIPTVDVAINQDIKALIFDNDKLDTNFLVGEIQSKENFILKSIVKTGTTVQSINIPDLQKMNLSVPKNINEQRKIGDFFKQLDDTIALHQRELEILKNTKKAFLQKMFV
ncbi:restriction endonuclease subunit S [Carnobacterium divergens]|uniref:Type I restriction enzyme specificity protein n=1 Tax=Carnobacterium divergens DSM 20623 TaxID=1449336 RepID=A0A0R2HVQ6_CARDV|nr:restriction endonuclease subunit S [Carnobacterium divergens]KRN56751.1 type I restriction enzyme specificity protein [Carnobacterium divergens DSM 20623]MDO0875864.1 restriction endonuclease subunit S [Carnobacterium divergens]SUX15240.1 Type I restriction modification DNA specificity domain [Carnobacterium divergens]